MSWVEKYKEKLVTAEEAVTEIKNQDRLGIGGIPDADLESLGGKPINEAKIGTCCHRG